MYRQGDVLLKPVEWIKGEYPSAHKVGPFRNRKRTDIILASGEATGHHHRVKESTARVVRRKGALVLLVSKRGATVTHEEHDPIELPAGAYEIIRQKEYTEVGRGLSTRSSSSYVRD